MYIFGILIECALTTHYISVIFVLFLRDAIVSLVGRLVQVDLDPAALIVLLNLDRLRLEPLQVFDLLDPSLERCLAAIVEDPGYDGAANSQKLVPADGHHDEHDQVEKRQLQNDKEAVKNAKQKDRSKRVQKCRLDAGALLHGRVVLRLERLVELLELAPERRIFDVGVAQLLLVLLAHVELLALGVPDEHLLDAGRARPDFKTVSAEVISVAISEVHLALLVFNELTLALVCQKLRLLLLFNLIRHLTRQSFSFFFN